jgi:predicted Rossmann-fold nucleotide-binding protein
MQPATTITAEYEASAVALGQRMVDEGIGLVYGGGTVGLMGVIAKTVGTHMHMQTRTHAYTHAHAHAHTHTHTRTPPQRSSQAWAPSA